MISPSLIESSMFSSSSSLVSSLMLSWSQLFVYYIASSSGLKHMTSFWFNCLFMDGFPCLLVLRKKHADAYGKDSKHANAMHISIIGSCGGSVGSVVGKDMGRVGLSGSFIACIASILLPFFTSFKILS